MVDRSKKLS